MVVQWSSTGKSAMDPDVSDIVGNVGIALLPGSKINGKLIRRPECPTGWVFGIPKYIPEERKEVIAKLIEIVSRPENALKICLDPKTYVDPWRKSSFDESAWIKVWPGYEDYAREFMNVQKKTLELGVPDLQIPGTDEYWKTLDEQISLCLAGRKTPKEALDDAAFLWEDITKRRGRDKQKDAWLKQLEMLKKRGITYIPYEGD